jgi:hypothetical protein
MIKSWGLYYFPEQKNSASEKNENKYFAEIIFSAI